MNRRVEFTVFSYQSIIFFYSKPSLTNEMIFSHRLKIANDNIFQEPWCGWTFPTIIMPQTKITQRPKWSEARRNNWTNKSWLSRSLIYLGTAMMKASIPPRCKIFLCGSAIIRIPVSSSSPPSIKWTWKYFQCKKIWMLIQNFGNPLWILCRNFFDVQWKKLLDKSNDHFDYYPVKYWYQSIRDTLIDKIVSKWLRILFRNLSCQSISQMWSILNTERW